MEFRVLGPVEAVADGDRLPIGGAKPRLLLAALLVEPGRVVPADRLIDIIWGDDPPDTARALIHTYVSTLRRGLNRPGEPEVIATRPPGYLIQIPPEHLDRVVFDRLVEQARAATRAGQLHEAVTRYHEAEALWRGSAFGGVGESALIAEAARLDEQRLAAISERIQVQLTLGTSDHLVVELTALVGRHPTHERLRAHLMVVLYRLGRQADALASYRQGRDALVDQLGIEPGPYLREVHDAILRNDPALTSTPALKAALSAEQPSAPRTAQPLAESQRGTEEAADEAEDAPVRGPWPRPLPAEGEPVPAQLPSSPDDFTGRSLEIAHLVDALRPDEQRSPICVIAGKGGAGKSTLAVRVAHELTPAFPDGQLFAELRGTTDAPVDPADVLGRFLRALGADPATLPESLDERVERYRTLLAGRRILIVLDDAEAERQVRPLLPGAPGCAVLVTARRRLPGLDGALLTELDMLAPAEAAELLARIAGPDRVEAEPAAAARIAELCGCLPLAVRIVGARLASRRHWSLGRMAGRLEDEARRLDELSVSDQQVRAGIEVAYRSLDPEARLALRHLGTLGLPDFPGWVVANLLDTDPLSAEDVVEQLVDAQLIDFVRADGAGQLRYRLHELVRLYAHERGEAEDSAEERLAATRRLVECWLWLVDQISQRAPSGTIPLSPPVRARPEPHPAIVKPIMANPRAWLDAEQAALVVGVERAAALDLVDVSVPLATALCGSVFVVGNLFEEWGRTHDAALAAARRAGDQATEATLLAQIGQLRCEQDRYAESHEYLTEAVGLFRDIGDDRGEATVRAALGTTCREQGHLRESMHFLGQAQAWFRAAAAAGDPTVDPALGYVDRLTGATRLEQGDFAGAEEDLTEAVAAYRRFACRRGEGMALRSLGHVRRAMGDLEPAARLSEEALAIFRELRDELLIGYGLQAVAKVRVRQGRPDDAEEPLAEALDILHRLGDRWGMAFVLRTRGEMHLAAGRLAAAEADLTESIAGWDALDVPLGRARSQRDLARVRQAEGNAGAAAELRAAALEVFQTYGAREAVEISSEITADLQNAR